MKSQMFKHQGKCFEDFLCFFEATAGCEKEKKTAQLQQNVVIVAI